MLERVWGKGNPPTPLVGMYAGTAIMENSMEVPQKKLKTELLYVPAIPLLGTYPEKTIIQKDTSIPMVQSNAAHSSQDRQTPKCPSTGERIKRAWYIWNATQP